MDSFPLVSICIPTYNRPADLLVVVQDILAQTYKNIEVVVTDDGDETQTRAHLAPVMDRIRYCPNAKRLGIYGNWNRSIAEARGQLIGVYHDHDRYDPTIVERCVELFLRSDRVGIVHVAAEQMDHGMRATHPDMPEIANGKWFAERQANLWWSYVAHGCMMVRADLYRRLGTFDESKGIVADMDMLVRFALECDVGFVRDVLYHYSGRTPKDAFHGFRWTDTTEYIPVRKLNLERVYADRPDELNTALARLQWQIDKRLVQAMVWLSLNGLRSQLEEGWPILARFASRPAYLATRALLVEREPLKSARSLSYATWRSLKAARTQSPEHAEGA